jgi:hypothetical protein
VEAGNDNSTSELADAFTGKAYAVGDYEAGAADVQLTN